jgi:hypothetical protein
LRIPHQSARVTLLALPALSEDHVWQMIHEMGRIKGAAAGRDVREVAGDVARHADRGGEPAVAYRHALLASEAAAARYAFEEALSWLDLAAGASASREESEAVDRRTAEVLHLAGWTEPPRPVMRPGTPARGFDQSDLDLGE